MNIRKTRQTLGMTVSEFAESVGVTPVQVRRYEMDPTRSTHRFPSRSVIMHVERLLSQKDQQHD